MPQHTTTTEPGEAQAASSAIRPSHGLLLLSLLIAFYTGFRTPNLWSLNYYLPNFIDGFHRRSLAGTLLYPLGDLRFHYNVITGIQWIVLATLLAITLHAAWRAQERTRIIVALAFLTPMGGYLFHEVGYIDQLLFLTMIAALATPNAVASGALMVATLFMHEMAAFTVVPLYALCRWHDHRQLQGIAITVALCAAAFGAIYAFFQTVDGPVIIAFVQDILAKADFRIRGDYYEVFDQRFMGDRLKLYYGQIDIRELAMAGGLALVAGWMAARAAQGWQRIALALAGFIAGASPLVLGFFGWDIDRWIFLATACAVFAMHRFQHVAGKHAQYAAMIVLGSMILFGRVNYFDGYYPRELTITEIKRFVKTDLRREISNIPAQ